MAADLLSGEAHREEWLRWDQKKKKGKKCKPKAMLDSQSRPHFLWGSVILMSPGIVLHFIWNFRAIKNAPESFPHLDSAINFTEASNSQISEQSGGNYWGI